MRCARGVNLISPQSEYSSLFTQTLDVARELTIAFPCTTDKKN